MYSRCSAKRSVKCPVKRSAECYVKRSPKCYARSFLFEEKLGDVDWDGVASPEWLHTYLCFANLFTDEIN